MKLPMALARTQSGNVTKGAWKRAPTSPPLQERQMATHPRVVMVRLARKWVAAVALRLSGCGGRTAGEWGAGAGGGTAWQPTLARGGGGRVWQLASRSSHEAR